MKKQIIFLLVLFFTSCSTNDINISSSTISSFTSTSSELVTSISSNENTSSKQSENTSIKSENSSQSTSITKPKLRIYLNPSVQTKNMYTGHNLSEADTMNIVAKKAYNLLQKDNRFIVYINDSLKPLKESVNEINSLNIDYHLALHSNAGGGSGSEVYYYENTSSYLAKHALNSFNKYHTFPTRGIKKNNTYYELKNSKAKNKALIEFLFHDKINEANFIVSNYDLLATSVYETFVNIINEQ